MNKTITQTIAEYTNEILASLDNLSFFTDGKTREVAFRYMDILQDWGDIRNPQNVLEEDLLEVCTKPEEMQQYFTLMLSQMPECSILNKYDERLERYKERFGRELAEQAENLIEWLTLELDGLMHQLLKVGKKYGLTNPYEEVWRNELRGTFEQTDTKKEVCEHTEQKPTRRRGRPTETLKDKMNDDEDGSKLQKIHVLMKGKKGKDAVLVLLACVLKGWMDRPTYTQVKNEFGDIGSKTGFNRYFAESMFTVEEIKGAKNRLD